MSATADAFARLDQDLKDIITAGGHPIEWDDYVGQEKAKKVLRRAAASAKIRDAVMGHALLFSPYAGIGKTSLAILTALEMGRGFRIASGKITLREMRKILADMVDGEVLIIDECHLLVAGGKANSEWLLPYMQSGKLIGPLGPEDFPRVTIIGTTTAAGALPGPVRERFAYQPALEMYTLADATEIAFMHAGALFPTGVAIPNIDCAQRLATAGSCRPRVIRHLVTTLLDLAIVGEVEGPDYDLSEVLRSCEVTDDGLNAQAQEYLRFIGRSDSPIGANVLSEHLGEKGDGLMDLERLLIDKGYLGRSRLGRELTRAGIIRAKQLSVHV